MIELLTVMVLVGILGAAAVSALPDSDIDLESEAENLSAHLRYAQIQAQTDTYQWRLVFTDSSTYQIGPVVIPGPGFTPRIVPGSNGMQGTLIDGVTIPAGTLIRFDSWGRPVSDAGVRFTADQTITLSARTQTQSITIKPETGLVP